VQVIKQITVFIFAGVFLLSTAGVLIYEIDCSRTGHQDVSFYVTPETCEDKLAHENFDLHCYLNTGDKGCDDCDAHNEDCGCSSPEIKYVRLVNQFTEEETHYLKTEATPVFPAVLALLDSLLLYEFEDTSEKFYIDPPPLVLTSFEYLIELNKLKIPEFA